MYVPLSDMKRMERGLKPRITNGKFCDNQCQGDYEWEEKKQIVLERGVEALNLEGEYKHQTHDKILKQIIIEESPHGKSKRACWKCGWEKANPYTAKGSKSNRGKTKKNGKPYRENRFVSNIPTQLNHIDGDPLSNDISNLEILCPNCHALTEFFGSRGKGGRKR